MDSGSSKNLNKRWCYFVPETAYVEGHGYRASIVVEGEAGHHPTGTWPYTGNVGETQPYFWGDDYETAKQAMDDQNRRLGLSDRDVYEILISSINAQHATQPKHKRWK